MRESAMRVGAGRFDDGEDAGGRSASLLRRWFRRRPHDAIAATVAGLAVGAIVVNALFLQTGPHPAPIFVHRPDPPAAPVLASVEQKPLPSPAKPRADVVAEIQRELSRHGFYDGPADGIYGPKTDAAIRDFEDAAGLRPSAEPNDVLLRTIAKSSIKAKPAAPQGHRDPIADLLAPNPRVIAVQRALSAYGYGQVSPSGVYDPDTRSAIERFERENRLPVTGQISEQLSRQIATMTGRPLD